MLVAGGGAARLDELLSRRGAQVGSEPVEVDALCLELKPDRLGPSEGKAGQGQLPAASAAQLGSQRVTGIAQHAVEQMLGAPIPASPWA